MDFEKLVIDFEFEIQHERHDFVRKVRHSIAGNQIVAMGDEALPLIVNRLEENLSLNNEVRCAWAALIGRIGVEHQLGNPPFDLPFGEVSAWIAWAKTATNSWVGN